MCFLPKRSNPDSLPQSSFSLTMTTPTHLEPHTALTILHYISPTIQSFPQHLVASQLAFRQSCLKLTPDDPAYLFWPSSDDQHIIDALELLQQKPLDSPGFSDLEIRYTADDSLFAHVQLERDEPAGLRLVFQWEEGSWKYSNLARIPFPPNSVASLDDLPEIQLGDDGDSGEETPDSYWDSYGGPAPDRERDTVEFEREASTGSYWDMYSAVQGSGDSVIPSPAREKQRHDFPIPFSYAEMHPPTDPIDSLSDRLEALSQRPPPSDEGTDDGTIAVANGTSEVALKESLRGVWNLWRSTRATPTLSDHELFLSVVNEVLAEP
ncbi:hypothetical protein B0H19DRAFT_1127389 [Mycena capillaripes]|nr:hypothetical protein B0H19DRAFT_1127389 [Mycena capillaripes]